MDLTLTDEQRDFRRTAREFLDREVVPHRAAWDRRESVDLAVIGKLGDLGFFDMRVSELDPGRRVVWEVLDGPPEWVGTRVSWDLRQEGDHAILLFRHAGWREEVEFMHHCSTKWAIFLMSLKSLLETGQGSPHPKDVSIDNWN